MGISDTLPTHVVGPLHIRLPTRYKSRAISLSLVASPRYPPVARTVFQGWSGITSWCNKLGLANPKRALLVGRRWFLVLRQLTALGYTPPRH